MDGMVVEVRYQGIVVARGARTREVSAAGTFVELDAPLPVGAILTLAPEGGPVLRTRVARVVEVGTERGMAVHWSDLADEARQFLAAGLATPPVDAAAGGAPAAVAAPALEAASAAVSAVTPGDDATQPMTVPPRPAAPDATPPPGAVAEEVAPGDEISAPIDVPLDGADGAPRPEGANGDGGKGKRSRRRKK